jgi:uracil-DNA glycosylase
MHPEYERSLARYETALKNWGLFEKARAALERIDEVCEPDKLSPAPDLIFRIFEILSRPELVLWVIIGQDPYPNRKDAQGMSFSTPGNITESLKNVFKAVKNCGLAETDALSGNLLGWAIQGCALLNITLTTLAGKSRVRAHVVAWKPFSDAVIAKICEQKGRVIPFMLWGADAGAFAETVTKAGHVALRCHHPSPMSNNNKPRGQKFEDLRLFLEAAAYIKDGFVARGVDATVCFDCSKPLTVHLAIHKSSSAASYGLCFAGGTIDDTIASGFVPPFCFKAIDGENFRYTTTVCDPSPVRAEYLGGCWALLLALRSGVTGKVLVLSDEQIFVKTMTLWYPERLAKDVEMPAHMDLVRIAWDLYQALLARGCKVSFEQMQCEGVANAKIVAESHIDTTPADVSDVLVQTNATGLLRTHDE